MLGHYRPRSTHRTIATKTTIAARTERQPDAITTSTTVLTHATGHKELRRRRTRSTVGAVTTAATGTTGNIRLGCTGSEADDITGSHLLLATGRTPNTDALGL